MFRQCQGASREPATTFPTTTATSTTLVSFAPRSFALVLLCFPISLSFAFSLSSRYNVTGIDTHSPMTTFKVPEEPEAPMPSSPRTWYHKFWMACRRHASFVGPGILASVAYVQNFGDVGLPADDDTMTLCTC